jgi:hypothetical protein
MPIVEDETLDALANNRSGSYLDADDDTDLPNVDQILEKTLDDFLE